MLLKIFGKTSVLISTEVRIMRKKIKERIEKFSKALRTLAKQHIIDFNTKTKYIYTGPSLVSVMKCLNVHSESFTFDNSHTIIHHLEKCLVK